MSLEHVVEVLGIDEDSRKFVADVESVEFSSPELVDVSKADADTTVGEIKEARGLQCEYSADLTEEQIAEINAQTVDAGDWALISVRAFTSEESLTVTMKNGDQFVVRVTDLQSVTYSIAISPSNGGTLSKAPTGYQTKTTGYNNNGFTVTANSGYTFDHWEVNGSEATIDSSKITISNDGKTCKVDGGGIYIGETNNSIVTAVFSSTATSNYTITYTVNGNGSIDKTSGTSTEAGATATPDSGNHFVGWQINGITVSTAKTFDTSLVSENCTVTAVFEEGEPEERDFFQRFYYNVNPTGVGNTVQLTQSNGTNYGSAAETVDCITNTYENGKTDNNGNSAYYAKAVLGSG